MSSDYRAQSRERKESARRMKKMHRDDKIQAKKWIHPVFKPKQISRNSDKGRPKAANTCFFGVSCCVSKLCAVKGLESGANFHSGVPRRVALPWLSSMYFKDSSKSFQAAGDKAGWSLWFGESEADWGMKIASPVAHH